jgi:hypothetical protein
MDRTGVAFLFIIRKWVDPDLVVLLLQTGVTFQQRGRSGNSVSPRRMNDFGEPKRS